MTNFERLIAALDKEYADRNEGDAQYNIEIEVQGRCVGLFIYNSADAMADGIPFKKAFTVGPSTDPTTTGVEICALSILKQMGVTNEV